MDALKEIEMTGHKLEKVIVNPEELLRWCNSKGVTVNGSSRAEYALEDDVEGRDEEDADGGGREHPAEQRERHFPAQRTAACSYAFVAGCLLGYHDSAELAGTRVWCHATGPKECIGFLLGVKKGRCVAHCLWP